MIITMILVQQRHPQIDSSIPFPGRWQCKRCTLSICKWPTLSARSNQRDRCAQCVRACDSRSLAVILCACAHACAWCEHVGKRVKMEGGGRRWWWRGVVCVCMCVGMNQRECECVRRTPLPTCVNILAQPVHAQNLTCRRARAAC
jgi:hypothetical protein